MRFSLTLILASAVIDIYFAEGDAKGGILRNPFTGEQVAVLPLEPTCSFKTPSGSCCMSLPIKELNQDVEGCIKMTLSGNGKTNLALVVNGKEIVQSDVNRVGDICYPIPDTPVQGCLTVYHFEVENKAVEMCSFVGLRMGHAKLVNVDFGCMKASLSGEFDLNHDHTPASEGLVNVKFHNGRQLPVVPSFTFNSPIKVSKPNLS